ncbi:MAG TPA: hypothetical protein VFQ88_12275, partial [Nevskiaceae bacterium]|nr:hypothetical protein [Nevskiaceae bacterium]
MDRRRAVARCGRRRAALCVAALVATLSVVPALAYAQDDALSAATLNRIRDTALASDYAQRELFILADQIGARPSGSVQAQAAVHQVADALQTLGLNVGMIPVQVPHWVRGGADAAIVRYT